MVNHGQFVDDMAADESLDLRGIPCPQNAAKAVVKLSTMMSGERLHVRVDDGEPVDNVSASVEGEGHKVVLRRQQADGSLPTPTWHLLIEVDGQTSTTEDPS
ncbi:MAG TPA: sulfurtransferase TusA family protein [Pseudobdellovibrionaceae bacterium]|nr:sulfurtransferase TusA family protein [Pseudobdellovibrionaceae bacterium]